MSLSPLEFRALLERAKDGDQSAFGHLLDHYVRKLYQEARRLIGRQLRALVDPADLIQATRLILWQGLCKGKFQVDSPQALVALAKILLRRQAARVCRALKHELTAKTLEFRLSESGADVPIYASDDSQERAEETDLHQAMERLLGCLDEVDREMVRMRVLGYTTARVAQEMQIDAGYLRVRLGRLRKRLSEFGAVERLLAS